jgi:3',5'-cyclic AMP phosphodiesterase CpdA
MIDPGGAHIAVQRGRRRATIATLLLGLMLHATSSRSAPWSFVVLPDTQHYAEQHPEIFEAQTRWVAAQREALDIRFLLHAGDVTNTNSDAEWQVARRAFDHLEGQVPYVIALGNHDLGRRNDAGLPNSRGSGFSRHFLPQRLQQAPTYGGSFEADALENSYHVFDVPDGPWLAMALEFAPRHAVLAWADRVLSQYRTLPALVLTHAYLNTDGTLDDLSRYLARAPIGEQGINGGPGLWERLLRHHDNVVMVLCGHNHGAARRVDHTDGGRAVHQLLADYQDEAEGGGGFLRLVQIDPRQATAQVRTYSPHLNQERFDASNHFTLSLPRHSRVVERETRRGRVVELGLSRAGLGSGLAERSAQHWARGASAPK